MGNPDLTRLDERLVLIEQIESEENITRKRREQRKLDVYRNNHAPYVMEKLEKEFSQKTVQLMRTVLSLNPCPRIINEMASLYTTEPVREFSNASDNELDQIQNIYDLCKVDTSLRLTNR